MQPPFTASYHTHSEYCDGAGRLEEVVEAAIDAGLTEIGLSSHAPLPFVTEWTMDPQRLVDYIAEIRQLQDRYGDRIRVLLGAELDFIPDGDVLKFQREAVFPVGFDYFVGSVHFLGTGYPPRSFDGTEAEFREILQDDYGGNMALMVADYYERVQQMVQLPGVKIVGHLDLIKRWNARHDYFTGDEPWYIAAVDQTLDAIATSGLIVELNTAGWKKGLGEPYPSPSILERCRQYNIPITISSDSHTPGDVTRDFGDGLACLNALRIEPVRLPVG